MDHLQSFAQDQWPIIAGAVVVLLIIVKLVKTAVKWAIILAIAAGLLVYGSNYKDTLGSIKDAVVETASGTVADSLKREAAKAIQDEAKEAKYTANADGSFTIKSKSVQVTGKPGDQTVVVTVAGQTFHMKMVDAVSAFIEQAKKNG